MDNKEEVKKQLLEAIDEKREQLNEAYDFLHAALLDVDEYKDRVDRLKADLEYLRDSFPE